MSATVIAFDFGLRHIGTAIGLRLTGQARPLIALKASHGTPNWQQLATLLHTWQPEMLVVGLPLNMDGSEQPLTQSARQFADALQRQFSLPVCLQDERLSTVEARARLFEQGGYRALTKSQVDTLAATIILESWLETSQSATVPNHAV
jgi:putative Holliday junction resolvase